MGIGTCTCCLCGQSIDSNAIPEKRLSMDHVPPKQFYPKQLRKERDINLWLVPTHKCCNEDYRKDEEYFYHTMYMLVKENNPKMGKLIFEDLVRRTNKRQTPAMIRKILSTITGVTEGGIRLPQSVRQYEVNIYRIQRVVIKIAQELVYLDCNTYVPFEKCKDIRMCLNESDVPELYFLSWQGGKRKRACGEVFSYRRFKFENYHLLSMLFWKSLMFCCAFESSKKC